MNSKEYTLPNGKKAVFEYDVTGVGKVTLGCMDMLMAMIADRAEGEWVVADDESILFTVYKCSRCGKIHAHSPHNYCPNCGAKMTFKE